MNQPPPVPHSTGFHRRNWWSNGASCKVLTVSSIICGLSLLGQWRSTFSGYVRQGNFEYLTTYAPADNAFSDGAGWVLAPILFGILRHCGRPRAATMGMRWAPLTGAVVIFVVAVSTAMEIHRANEAWVAGFSFQKPRVESPAGLMWTCLTSVIMMVSGWVFGRRRGIGVPNQP